MPEDQRRGDRPGFRALSASRSLLRVPVDAAWEADALLRSGADAIVIEMPTIDHADRPALLERVRAVLAGSNGVHDAPARLVALDLSSAAVDADLDVLMPGRPDGVVLSPCRSPAGVQRLGAKLAVHEAERGFPPASTAILAVVGGTAEGLLALSGYAKASNRLTALIWDAAALAADLGACAAPTEIDDGSSPLGFARAMTLLAARAAGLSPIDTATDEDDLDRLAAASRRARRMGYTGKVAVSIRQVARINACFSPDRAP